MLRLLPGALGVPDDAATVRGVPSRLQPVDCPVHGTELLVARHHLPRPSLDLVEDGEVAYQVDEVLRAQHAGDQDLLAVQVNVGAAPRRRALVGLAEEQRCPRPVRLLGPGGAELLGGEGFLFGVARDGADLLGDGAQRHRTGVGPLKVCLRRCANGARPGFEQAAGNQQLVVVEQPLDTFVIGVLRGVQLLALVRVAKELVEGRAHRVLNRRALELRHGQRDAVDKQNGIGNHLPPFTRQRHLELVDDQEVVVVPVVEVEEVHCLRPTVVPIGQPFDRGSLQQQFRSRLVRLHEPVLAQALQLTDGPVEARVIQPWSAIRPGVDAPHRSPQSPLEQHVPEPLTMGQLRHIGVALQPLPAHCLELLAERLLDEVVFPLNAHRLLPPAPSPASSAGRVPLQSG